MAAELVRRQGISVEGLYIKTGFSSEDVKERLGIISPEDNPVRLAARSINLPLREVDISDTYCEVIENPRYGYGKNANPCVDCKIRFFKTAAEIMRREGFDFVVSGEVLNQRPKSQRIDIMRIIEREAGLEGWVVRPLSAKLLPPSEPEKLGWVDREKFLAIKGKNRAEQLRLARELGLSYVPQPSGGCLLTMEEVGRRVFGWLGLKLCNPEAGKLIPIGRHFLLPENVPLVVARNREEAQYILKNFPRFPKVKAARKGTVALAFTEGELSEGQKALAGALVARYSKNRPQEVVYLSPTGRVENFFATPLGDEQIWQLRLKPPLKEKT